MRAAVYSRYSDKRKQDANSPAAQIRNCKVLIEREGWTLVGTYGDEGITGTDNERPGYKPEPMLEGWKKVFAFLDKHLAAKHAAAAE